MHDIKQRADIMLANIKKEAEIKRIKEENRILENRLKREAKEQSEAERLEQSNQVLNKYLKKAMEREKAKEASLNQTLTNINVAREARRRAEQDEQRAREVQEMIARGNELIKKSAKYN